MENRAQVSIEYLIMVGLGVIIAGIAVLLAANLFGIKDGIKSMIESYRKRVLQLK